MEPVTAAVIVGAGVAKGASGYKAGQASSEAAMASAMYNQQIAQLNAQMEEERGRIVRQITERNALEMGERAAYNAFLLGRQAEEVEEQADFDFIIANRQYDIFTAEKRARWGTSGVTMAGSPAVVALADASAAAMNLANIELRGIQAVNRVEQAQAMTIYKGKVDYNNMMQQAFIGQYNSDIQRANIINQGNMDYYAGAVQAYSAQQAANAALIGAAADTVSGLAGAGAFAGGGGPAGNIGTATAYSTGTTTNTLGQTSGMRGTMSEIF